MSWTLVEEWQKLDGVHPFLPDPYCIWAGLTEWADYREADVGRSHPLIVELNDLGKFLDAIKRHADDIEVPTLYGVSTEKVSGPFVTALVSKKGLRLMARRRAISQHVVRFDLCDFIRPARDEADVLRASEPLFPPLHPSVDKLIGIIDDGCPFAHQSFLHGPSSTRIAAIWDQDGDAPAFMGTGHGSHSRTLAYGREIRRRYVNEPVAQTPKARPPLGLNAWIAAHSLNDGTVIDEDACYLNAGYDSVRRRVAHGAHVMDLLAGPVPLANRLHTTHLTPPAPVHAERPPSWQPSGPLDNAPAADPERSDIVFVQLPRAGLQDSSGGWLDSHVLDAVRYIHGIAHAVSAKSPNAVKQTVINLSYGSTVGPHDGSSILGKALDHLLTRSSLNMQLVTAAGNSFSARGHAELSFNTDREARLIWQVPPGSETPAFVQFWFPEPQQGLGALKLQMRITPPGASVDRTWSKAGQVRVISDAPGHCVATCIHLKESSRGSGSMALLAIAPTDLQDTTRRSAAPHGDWIIDIRSNRELGEKEKVHAYISRNDPDIGAARRGRQSRFIDPVDDESRFLRVPNDDPGKDAADDHLFGPQRRTGQVRRRGTLNGIGSGSKPQIIAGYQRQFSDLPGDGRPAPYSSAGKLDDGRAGRIPTASLPSDESVVLSGIRAAGTRSGSTFRLVGTSTAAPQRARKLLRDVPPAGNQAQRPAPAQETDCDPERDGEECRGTAVVPPVSS